VFDISFSEMVVIAVITLIVVGPERLPKVARTLGHLWGRAQRYINGVKADISRDMALEELRQLQAKVQQEADAVTSATRTVSQQVDQQVQQLNMNSAQITAPQQSDKHALPEQQKSPIN
jgi:sec-independent protein translocase protein TatB